MIENERGAASQQFFMDHAQDQAPIFHEICFRGADESGVSMGDRTTDRLISADRQPMQPTLF